MTTCLTIRSETVTCQFNIIYLNINQKISTFKLIQRKKKTLVTFCFLRTQLVGVILNYNFKKIDSN